MKLDKLAKQLRRDLLANKMKAAILGVMVLVALYFWAPLAWGWLSKGGGKSSAADQGSLILEDEPLLATAPQKTGGKAKPFRWEKVWQAITSDKRMASAAFDPAWTDPFLLPKVIPPAPPPETSTTDDSSPANEATAAARAKPVTLHLSSIAIGRRYRTATINGNTYREGQSFSIDEGTPDTTSPDEASTPPEAASANRYLLVRVEPSGVELEQQGQRIRLEFDRLRMARGDKIERAPGDD